MSDELAEQNEELVDVEEAETDEIEEHEDETDSDEKKEPSLEEEADEEEVVVSFDGKEPEEEEDQPAPAWVKDLRKAHRNTQKENRDLRKKLEALEKPAPKVAELRKKPTLEDYDYDADEFESSLENWFDEKRKNDDAKRQEKEAQEAQNESWNTKLQAYEEAKTQMKVKDFTDAEEEVLEGLSDVQQGIIVQGADNPALVVYALGKNPEKIKALSAEKDPVRFAFAVAKLEKDLKMVKKSKKAPDPERRVTGSARGGASDSTLEKLREEAAKTGNYSKVTAYKRSKSN